MVEKRSYKSYSKEFRVEAVALVCEQGYSVAEAAKQLSIAANLLYRWKQKIDSGIINAGLSLFVFMRGQAID